MNDELKKFDAIRPFEPAELPQVYDRLLSDGQFLAVVHYLYPQAPIEAVAQKMHTCKSSLEFQKAFCYEFIENLLEKASTGCEMDVQDIDVERRYTFISNHRDIVLDSAILDKLLLDVGFSTTCEIAIGDNLLSLPWVKDLVRVNKSFIVERSLSVRELLAASKRLSEYMHYAIAQKHENIWIAQREGRAKDSDDQTQESILKMMAMGGEGTIVDRLVQLHLVPLSISYEYDPCDFLKAREFQLRRDVPGWKKSAQDDVVSMQTGIMGYKGHIHYHAAPCIDEWLNTLPEDMPKADLFRAVTQHIDQQIHSHYRIYPNHYIALDLLHGNDEHGDRYTVRQRQEFIDYLHAQLARIDLPGKDEPFLLERLLTMYANPLRNYLEASKQK